MASRRTRSTRKLRSWMVEQVNSRKYPGLEWDNDAKTMFRIPWKHAGKQDFRSEEDAAIFKAWAAFKGKLSDGDRADPASWKTRLRCALNKSTEFREVGDRSQLDISEPYKVYLLVPINEQGLVCRDIKGQGRTRRGKRRSSESDSEEKIQAKQMKEEVVTSIPISMSVQETEEENCVTVELNEDGQSTVILKSDAVDEIQVNFTIETVPLGAQDSFLVLVKYIGQEVLRREIIGSDIRITFLPSAPVPPTSSSMMVGAFPRIPLPEPPSTLTSMPGLGPRLQALSTLLPFMEKGMMLTTTGGGVYGKRFCQGRVFWTGPHTPTQKPNKMDRAVDPVMLFNREVFRQKLDIFRSYGGDPPQCGITLCFGEEFCDKEDPSSKLIITEISFPWAKQQVKEAQAFRESMTLLQQLASRSPLGEVTLSLVPVPSEHSITGT